MKGNSFINFKRVKQISIKRHSLKEHQIIRDEKAKCNGIERMIVRI